MPYKVTGRVIETESGWGVPNVIVEVWDHDERTADDRLGSSVTLPDGSFAILFREDDFSEGGLDRKPDLYLIVRKPDGTAIFSSVDNVRVEAGRRESFVVQVARNALGEMAPKERVELDDVARGVDLLSIEEEEFVEAAIGQERSSRRRAVMITAAIVVLSLPLLAWFFMRGSESNIAKRVADRWGPAVVLIRTPTETGSGIVFDTAGHILTNYHVVDDGGPYTVRLGTGRSTEGRVVGIDPRNDLAVVAVDAQPSELVVAPRGDPKEVNVGDLSIALGNPLGLERTLTVGHVSAINRSLETADPYGGVIDGVIQTDAAINPGSSGGALFNAKGQIVGVNTQIVTIGGGSVGLGFAVPIDLAARIAQTLITDGHIDWPFLGVAGASAGAQGVRVDHVTGQSPATQAGIQHGDVIVAVGGTPVSSPAELTRLVERHAVGETVDVTIQRGGQEMKITVTLAARPDPTRPARIVQIEPSASGSDLTSEWVEIENQGYRTVSLAGYTLSDSNGNTYTFPNVSLAPLQRVRLYTGAGTDEGDTLYWNAKSSIWQASSRAVLLDTSGQEVNELTY
jgi:putative serine protease PepD